MPAAPESVVDEGAVLNPSGEMIPVGPVGPEGGGCLPWSKTDQVGQGRKVAIPRGAHRGTCPVTALQEWIAGAGITDGPIFREVDRHGKVGKVAIHRDTVGAIIKPAVGRAGFEEKGFAGHSLRAGFATQAARNGASAFDIMRQTGHRSITTVSRYVREAQIFRDAPASKLGL